MMPPADTASATDRVIERHDAFMTLNYPRYPITMVAGSGCDLTDSAGNEYLDLFSGFGANILGHCHPELIDAAETQARKLWHVGNLLHTEPQTQLAERIARHGFGGRSYFCHSGSDANEAAFKLARLHGRGERFKIIATNASFHGRGFAAMMATGQQKVRAGYEPWLAGFEHVPFNDLDAMAAAVDEKTVAIIVEPIQGEGGIHVPDAGYLPGLRRLCDDRDLLLICDEVWTGCGRTGRWFAHQHDGIEPDVMTLGKAVGCGLPVAVMCAAPRVAELFSVASYGGVPHATTLGGSCIPMAVSARMFDVIERQGLVDRAEALGEMAMQSLRDLNAGPVRGRGLFIGIKTERPAADVVRAALDRGVLLGAAGDNVVRLAPPLIVSESQMARGIEVIGSVLES